MNPRSRRWVRERAGDRCEYCRFHQSHEPFYRFHIEHIVAEVHGGTDEASNLALACHHCNERKGTNLSGINPGTGRVVRLFDPRRQRWHDHFRFDGPLIVGRTGVGRATVAVLAMNASDRVELRSELISEGIFFCAGGGD